MVMRHAMVDCLRHPPPGTADLVRRHFGLLRHRLADTVRRWVRAAPTEDLRTKLDEQVRRGWSDGVQGVGRYCACFCAAEWDDCAHQREGDSLALEHG